MPGLSTSYINAHTRRRTERARGAAPRRASHRLSLTAGKFSVDLIGLNFRGATAASGETCPQFPMMSVRMKRGKAKRGRGTRWGERAARLVRRGARECPRTEDEWGNPEESKARILPKGDRGMPSGILFRDVASLHEPPDRGEKYGRGILRIHARYHNLSRVWKRN